MRTKALWVGAFACFLACFCSVRTGFHAVAQATPQLTIKPKPASCVLELQARTTTSLSFCFDFKPDDPFVIPDLFVSGELDRYAWQFFLTEAFSPQVQTNISS